MWNEWPDEDVGDPALVRSLGLITPEGTLLGGECLAVQPGAPQLLADRALGDADP